MWTDPDLADDDLRDIRARVGSLYAQALIECGRPLEAEAPLREARRIARGLGDDAGIAATADLVRRVASARAEAARQATATAADLDAPIDGTGIPRADALLRRAGAEADAGRREDAARHAEEALSIAEAGPREQVLAHLVLARTDPARTASEIALAFAIAEAADDFTLAGTVVRAAELAGVALPTAPFAGRP